jgi:hypothetical protein
MSETGIITKRKHDDDDMEELICTTDIKNTDTTVPAIKIFFKKGTVKHSCSGGCNREIPKERTLCGKCFDKRNRKYCNSCKKQYLNDDIDIDNRSSYDKHECCSMKI